MRERNGREEMVRNELRIQDNIFFTKAKIDVYFTVALFFKMEVFVFLTSRFLAIVRKNVFRLIWSKTD